MLFRVVVAGSRGFSDFQLLSVVLDRALSRPVASGCQVVVLSGGARGADSLGAAYAAARGFPVWSFPADWARFGRAAGPLRNAAMVRSADAAVVFWDGSSRGSADLVRRVRAAGLPLRVVLCAPGSRPRLLRF